MKRKGFTLIELLAVIVILAIIALIATPIVLNIIDSTRDNADRRSVELYADAVKNAVGSYYLREKTNPKTGDYSCEEEGKKLKHREDSSFTLTVEFDGKIACETVNITAEGVVTLTNVTVNGGSSQYTYDEKGTVTKVGDAKSVELTFSDIKDSGITLSNNNAVENQSYSTGLNIPQNKTIKSLTVTVKMGDEELSGVYNSETKTINIDKVTGNLTITIDAELDDVESDLTPDSICTLDEDSPIQGTDIGAKYSCKVKDTMEEAYPNGYTFYVLSNDTSTGKTNLIMDSNICEDGTLSNTCYVAWDSSGSLVNGPATAMPYLNTATSSWNTIFNETYDDKNGNYTGFTINSKARLPKYDELNTVGCNSSNSSCPTYFQGRYWTLDTRIYNSANKAWALLSGTLSLRAPESAKTNLETDGVGVRPVISVDLTN